MEVENYSLIWYVHQVNGKGIAVGIGQEVNIGLSAQVIKS